MKQSGDQLLHGPYEGFFAGGELSVEGRPRNGKRYSEWKYYDRDGRLKAAGKYVDGEFDEAWSSVGVDDRRGALTFFRRQR
jgi:antitoxin component YwqK of YwqJK toxin-antitoxin module